MEVKDSQTEMHFWIMPRRYKLQSLREKCPNTSYFHGVNLLCLCKQGQEKFSHSELVNWHLVLRKLIASKLFCFTTTSFVHLCLILLAAPEQQHFDSFFVNFAKIIAETFIAKSRKFPPYLSKGNPFFTIHSK